MGTEKLGIANVKILLLFALELGNVADSIGRHPEKGVARYGKLLDLMDEMMALGTMKLDQVVPEFEDLDDAEKADLMAAMKSKFDIEDDKLEGAIEDGLGIVVDAVSLVQKSISLVKSFKA